MSQERRQRRNEKLGIAPPRRNWRRIAMYALIVAAVLGAALYVNHRDEHKHDNFARCLADRGVKMYGAYWCPHCQEEKEKFGASFEYVPYVECGIKGDARRVSQACTDAGIHLYPTWQFPPTGERVERVFTLQELSDRTGCPLP